MRIAFCISGQIRTPLARLQHLSAEADRLGAEVFISTWRNRGRKTFSGATQPYQLARLVGHDKVVLFPARFFDGMATAFPHVQKWLEDEYDDVEPDLHSAFPKAYLDIEDEGRIDLSLLTRSTDSNSLKMLYKIWRANRMKAAAEKESRFDAVFRLRADVLPNFDACLATNASTRDAVVLAPSSKTDDYANDVYWYASTDVDDVISRLFAKAIAGPWVGIHQELHRHIIGNNVSISYVDLSQPLGGDLSPSDRSNLFDRIVETLTHCNAIVNADENINQKNLAAIFELSSRTADVTKERIDQLASEASSNAERRALILLKDAAKLDPKPGNVLVSIVSFLSESKFKLGSPLAGSAYFRILTKVAQPTLSTVDWKSAPAGTARALVAEAASSEPAVRTILQASVDSYGPQQVDGLLDEMQRLLSASSQ